MQSERQDTADEPELDPASLDAIRSLMADHEEPEEPAPLPPRASAAEKVQQEMTPGPVAPMMPPRKADGLPDLAAVPPALAASQPAKSSLGSKLVNKFKRKPRARKVTPVATPAPQSTPATYSQPQLGPQTASQPKSALARKIDELKAKVLGYRPTLKHVAWGSLALLVLLRPWLVVGILFLTLFVVIGVFLILGYDGFWRRVMAIGRWYARRNPERSVELHRKLDQFAVRFDGFLDRFPEGSVDGLYLPDFGDVAEAEARHNEAMERRLASMQQSEA